MKKERKGTVLIIKRKEKKILENKKLGTISAGCLEGSEVGWMKVGERDGRTSGRVLLRDYKKLTPMLRF